MTTCKHLGPIQYDDAGQILKRVCETCHHKTRFIVFKCLHPTHAARHPLPIVKDCQKCGDFEPDARVVGHSVY
jgi:hypothetical protein